MPGFYLPADELDGQGLTVWEPVTAELDYGRWLAAAYSDTTLITQFDGDETDWTRPAARHGECGRTRTYARGPRYWRSAPARATRPRLPANGSAPPTSRAWRWTHTGWRWPRARCMAAVHADAGGGGRVVRVLARGEVRPDRGRLFLPRGAPDLLTQARPGGKILLTLSGWLYGCELVADR